MNSSPTARRIALAVMGALAVAAGSMVVFGKEAPKARTAAPSITVTALTPTHTSFARVIAATGTVSPRDELLIGSDATGVRLLEVLVDTGSAVRKGQLLARGDDSQLQAQLAQQIAQVKHAEAELAQARANLERAERLQDFFSVEAVQTRRTNAASAAAKLDLALAQRRELEIKAGHTRVVAPADGVISRRVATVGAVVQHGTELFRMIRGGELEWRAELPNHSLQRVEAGAPARIVLDDGRAVPAKVRLVAPTIDAQTRNGMVYVTLPGNAGLKAGAHTKGEILLGVSEALALPEAAVMTRDGYPYVYTVGGDGVARLTKVETGARQQGFVEITAGLRADATVIKTGAGFVKDGDLVRVAPSTSQVSAKGGQS